MNGAARQKAGRSAVVRAVTGTPRRRFRDLVEMAEAVLWEADPRTLRLSFITGRATDVFGYPLERWLGSAEFLHKIVVADDRPALRERARNMRENGGTVEFRVRTAEERVIWVREAIRVTRDHRGQRSAVHGAMVDVSEIREAEDMRLRLQTMIDANARAAVEPVRTEPAVDESGRGRFQQHLAAGIDDLLDPIATASRLAKALGETLNLGFVAVVRTGLERSAALAWWPTEAARREHLGACELVDAVDTLDGSLPFVPLHVRCPHVPPDVGAVGALPLVTEAGEMIGALAIGAHDRPRFGDPYRVELRWYALQIAKALSVAITAERLAAGVMRDPLTGLLRREEFYARFAQELSRANRAGGTLALLRWDLVGFSEFNELHGRRIGDRALRTFADVVRAELRRYDVAGRIDGDSLAALLFVNRHQEAHIAAARIQKSAALARVGGVFIPFPARGFALYPDDGRDVATLERVSLVRLCNHKDMRLTFARKDAPAVSDEALSVIEAAAAE